MFNDDFMSYRIAAPTPVITANVTSTFVIVIFREREGFGMRGGEDGQSNKAIRVNPNC